MSPFRSYLFHLQEQRVFNTLAKKNFQGLILHSFYDKMGSWREFCVCQDVSYNELLQNTALVFRVQRLTEATTGNVLKFAVTKHILCCLLSLEKLLVRNVNAYICYVDSIGPATKAVVEEVAPPTAGWKKFSAYQEPSFPVLPLLLLHRLQGSWAIQHHLTLYIKSGPSERAKRNLSHVYFLWPLIE